MRVLFAHDHIFQTLPDGRVFSNGKLPYDVLRRYLEFFDEVEVVARGAPVADESATGSLTLSSGPGVRFSLVKGGGALSSQLHLTRQVRQLIERVEADAVIARLPSRVGNVAAQLAEEHDLPIAVEVVQCAWDALRHHSHPLAKFYAPWAYMQTRRAVRRANFALYVTDRFLQARYPSKGLTRGISDVALPPSEEQVLQDRLARLEDSKGLNIGLMGNLSKIKGIDTALMALADPRLKQRHVTLQIVSGDNRHYWEKEAQRLDVAHRVSFVGRLPGGGAVQRWLDSVDLYIQPSRAEGLPRAVIEAMSRGCPVLGARVGGIPELIESECVHRPGDHQDLARLIEQAEDREWLKQRAIINFQHASRFGTTFLDEKRREFLRAFRRSVDNDSAHVNGRVV